MNVSLPDTFALSQPHFTMAPTSSADDYLYNSSSTVNNSPSQHSLHTTSQSAPNQNISSINSRSHTLGNSPNLDPYIFSPDPGHQDNTSFGPSPTISSTSSSKSPPQSKKSSEPPSKIEKRTRNTIAARRYRQKRVDQVSDLEAALRESESARNELKVRVARLEGELEALKGLLKAKS